MSGPATSPKVDAWTVGLLAIRVAVVVSVIVGIPAFPGSAAERYTQVANEPGVPYRDVEVEYAPGELAIAEVVGSVGPTAARALLAFLAFAGDIAAFITIRRGGGRTPPAGICGSGCRCSSSSIGAPTS